MLRIVLDANVVVSALLQPKGPSGRIVERLVRGGSLRLILSPPIAEEYLRSLGYSKIRRRHGLSTDEIEAWVGALALLSDMVAGDETLKVVVRDPDDDKYLAAAVEGRASFVVSGDHHLLDLGAHEGIRILPPRALLGIMGA